MREEKNNQENTGLGAIQIHGNHNTVNHHQHSHTHNHTHHHQHCHAHTVHAHGPVHIHAPVQQSPFALQAPPAPPARRGKRSKQVHEVTPAQKELLALMRPLPPHVRVQVLDFMRSEFGTGMVMELDPRELQSTRQRVLDARRLAGI